MFHYRKPLRKTMFSFKLSKCWLLILWCVYVHVCMCMCVCFHMCCEYLHLGPFTILPHGRPTMFLHPLWILHNYPGSSYLWYFTILLHPWILLCPKLKGPGPQSELVDLVHTDRIIHTHTNTTIIFKISHCNGLQLKECQHALVITSSQFYQVFKICLIFLIFIISHPILTPSLQVNR